MLPRNSPRSRCCWIVPLNLVLPKPGAAAYLRAFYPPCILAAAVLRGNPAYGPSSSLAHLKLPANNHKLTLYSKSCLVALLLYHHTTTTHAQCPTSSLECKQRPRRRLSLLRCFCLLLDPPRCGCSLLRVSALAEQSSSFSQPH